MTSGSGSAQSCAVASGRAARYDGQAMRVDRIFEGGTLLTMDPARPRATALAVVGGRIVAVGDGDELRRHLDAERVVSLQGRTVVPGFHDAHNHMPSFGLGLSDIALSSPPIANIDDVLRAVKARAASQPADSWVIGSGYDQNKLAERRHPTAAELDAVAPDHLVWLRHNRSEERRVGKECRSRLATAGYNAACKAHRRGGERRNCAAGRTA